jgi:hypothetical protein
LTIPVKYTARKIRDHVHRKQQLQQQNGGASSASVATAAEGGGGEGSYVPSAGGVRPLDDEETGMLKASDVCVDE